MISMFGVTDRPRELSRGMAFDIRPLYRNRYLVIGSAYGTWVKVDGRRLEVKHEMLDPTHMDIWWDGDYGRVVDITWTPCTLGGERPWFVCPGCERRCAILYAPDGELLCRRCQNLVYPSQNMTFGERAYLKANKIREKLGWEPGIATGQGSRPKGMHETTFQHARFDHACAGAQALADSCRKMKIPYPDPSFLTDIGLDQNGRRLAKSKKQPRRRAQKPG